MEQNSLAWHVARLGKPTASRFGSIREKWVEKKAESNKKDDVIKWIKEEHPAAFAKIEKEFPEDLKGLTVAKLKPIYDKLPGTRSRDGYTQGGETYLNECIAETLSGVIRELKGASLDWGHEQEPKARFAYEMRKMQSVKLVGFVPLRNVKDGRIWAGASPDGLVGPWDIIEDDEGNSTVSPLSEEHSGGIEIKSPFNPAVHTATIRSGEVPEEYLEQILGNMLVTGAKWWDFISFHPEFGKHSLFVKRVHSTPEKLEEMASRVRRFDQSVMRELKKLS